MLRIILLLLLSLSLSSSSRQSILVWQDVSSRSHFIALRPLVRRLADDGHDVVYVSAWPDAQLAAHKNVELIHVANSALKRSDSRKVFEGEAFDFGEITQRIIQGQNASLHDDRVLRLLREDRDRFGAVIISFFCMDIGLHAARHIFKAPYAIFSAGGSLTPFDLAVGNPITPSYVPVGVSSVGSVMTFVERLQNTLTAFVVPLGLKWWLLPPISKHLRSELKLDYEPDLWADLMESDMVILNTHPVLDAARPVTFNTILVGGIHMDEPHHQKLPQNLKKWMDEAKEGVIVVSFGSILSSEDLPESKLSAFLSVFRTRSERIVWKWEADTMPDKPDNVFITQWMPQADVLAHPNVVLFVTHGGLLGCQEALSAGVPMIVLPGFGDQFANAQRVTTKEWGHHILWQDLDEPSLRAALETILGDVGYKQRTVEVSKILKDELVSPVSKAAFHVAHMMRHEGNPHLRPSSKHLRWYELMLIDVIGAILVLLYVLFTIVNTLFSVVRKLCCLSEKSEKNKATKKKKKN